MPKGKDFTTEQWDEIYAARSRLEAYKLKIQPYPAYPEEPIPVPEPKWTGRQWDKVEQTRAMILYLQNKLNEHIDKLVKNNPKDTQF